MTTVRLQQFTVTKKPAVKGSTQIAWNVDLNGAPFAQIWTFKAYRETHLYHAKTLAGAYDCFNTYDEAEAFVRGQA